MRKLKSLVYPLLLCGFFLLCLGFFLGRRSVNALILSTDRRPPVSSALPAAETAEPPQRQLPLPDPEHPQEGVNLNTADLEALMTLPDIGPGRAQKILDYRETHGPFQNIYQLTEVPGIGEGIFNKLRDLIYVEDSHENTDH